MNIARSHTDKVRQVSIVDLAVADNSWVKEIPKKLNDAIDTIMKSDEINISREPKSWENDSARLKGELTNFLGGEMAPITKFNIIIIVNKIVAP